MALNCGMSCVKYIMFIFNLVFAFTGLVILGIGAWAYHNIHHYVDWMNAGVVTSPVVLIAVGAIIFIVAFFGCCGAAQESHCMIMTFSVLLVAIFAVEVGVGVAGYMKHGELEHLVQVRFNESLRQYDTEVQVKNIFDMLQTDLKCCGANGYQDWIKMNHVIPDTCCASGLHIVNDVTETCSITSQNLHQGGCIKAMMQLIKENLQYLLVSALVVAGVQLLGVMFACCLARSIRNDYETV